MASGPIPSRQIDGETLETVRDFIFGGSKITTDGDCSYEIKRYFLLGRKAMTNLDSILKSRDIANKGLSSQNFGFSSSHVWMWELDYEESWTPKNWCFFFSFIFISWRLITLQYYSGICHTLSWISHGFTCIPHPNCPSHLPLYLIPLGLPSAPGLSTCLMHPTWAGDPFHPR